MACDDCDSDILKTILMVALFGTIFLVFVCVTPLALSIAGIVYLSLPDTRQININEFNTAVDNWESSAMSSFQSRYDTSDFTVTKVSGPSQLYIDGVVTEDTSTRHTTEWEVTHGNDHPPPDSWNPSFFEQNFAMDNIDYDGDLENFNWDATLGGRTVSGTAKIFWEHKIMTYRRCYTRCYGSHKHRTCTVHCDSPYTVCVNKGGTFEIRDGFNCWFNFLLERICLTVDNQGYFVTLPGAPETTTYETGCYRRVHLNEVPDLSFTPYYYSQTSNDDWMKLTVPIEIRSAEDPEILLAKWNYNFGMPLSTKVTIGAALLGSGLGICLILIICACIIVVLGVVSGLKSS